VVGHAGRRLHDFGRLRTRSPGLRVHGRRRKGRNPCRRRRQYRRHKRGRRNVLRLCTFFKDSRKQHPQRPADKADNRGKRGKEDENVVQASRGKARHHPEYRHQNRPDEHQQRALFHAPPARRNCLFAGWRGKLRQHSAMSQQVHDAFHEEATTRTKSHRIGGLLLAATGTKHKSINQWLLSVCPSLANGRKRLWLAADDALLAPMCPAKKAPAGYCPPEP
jgi:hypothetical protein